MHARQASELAAQHGRYQREQAKHRRTDNDQGEPADVHRDGDVTKDDEHAEGERQEEHANGRHMHGASAVHVRPDMNISATTLDPHEKTIDLRIDRLRDAVARATAIYTADTPQILHANRTVTLLVENRLFVSAYAQTVTEHIVSTAPYAMQDTLLAEQVRPLTILIEQANIATTRMRQIIGAHQ